jgi:hypothetical protein
MKTIILILLGLLNAFACYAQLPGDEMRKLKPLESTREDVETVLGKPEKYFQTYGLYRTSNGRFSVWYSNGKCQKNTSGLQWKVPQGQVTRIVMYPFNELPFNSYVKNYEDYQRSSGRSGLHRILYTSNDESVVFQTISRDDKSEYVYTIEVQPGKEMRSLLCSSRQ